MFTRLGVTACIGIVSVTLWSPFPAEAQRGGDNRALTNQLDAVRRDLATAAAQAINSPSLVSLLERRRVLLLELMTEDPALAMNTALPPELIARLQQLAPESVIETAGSWEGHLEVTVEDDFERSQSRMRWHLRTAERQFQLYVAAKITQKPGDAVQVTGLAVDGNIASAAIREAPPETAISASVAAQAACTTTGPQNIAVLMVTSPSNPAFPAAINQNSLQRGFFGSVTDTKSTDSLNGFWREMSYGQTSATGQVFGPFALQQDYTCDQSDQLLTAAVNAADSSVDFTQFTRIAIVFAVPSCASYGGLSTVGCRNVVSPSKGNLTASASWFPMNPSQNQVATGLFAHELGHALGMSHSSTEDYGASALGAVNSSGATVEYGDPFSLMGYPYNGSGYTAGHYPAQSKGLILHWLTAGDGYLEVRSPGTYMVSPLETGGVRGLRVLRDGTSGEWLWVEYRQPVGDVDGTLQYLPGSNAFQGALVHHENPVLDSRHTYLLDFNPSASPNNFKNAALAAGQSWSDPFTPLRLTVNSATASGLSVSVNYDTPCASLQFSATGFPAIGGSGIVTVTAPAGCAWTAISTFDWITITGASSGQGSAAVSFWVSGNGGASRSGSITVGRQNTRIVQSGSGITVWSLTPALGSGSSGQFTFQFTDSYGANDITTALLYFEPNSGCQVNVYPRSQQVSVGASYFFLNTAGAAASGALCTVYSDGSSVQRSGDQVTITLQISFATALAGSHRVAARAYGSTAGWSATQSLGTWTVPSGSSCTYQLSSTTVSFGAAGASGSANVTSQAGCAWTANSSASWLTIVAGASGSGNGTVYFTLDSNAIVGARSALLSLGGQSLSISQAGIVPQPVLSVMKAHSTSFAQGQANATYTVIVLNASSAGPTSGMVTVTEALPLGLVLVSMAGQGWTCATNTCTRNDALTGGVSYPAVTVTVNVAWNAQAQVTNQVSVSGGGAASANAFDVTTVTACGCTLNPVAILGASAGGSGTIAVTSTGCSWVATSNASWLIVTSGGSASGNGTVGYSFAANPNGAPRSGTITIGSGNFTVTQAGAAVAPNLRFVPITPCRVADTRNLNGPLGGPSLDAGTRRDFPIPASTCGIPASAMAYSLNMTVVPLGPLGFLSVWPAGQTQPYVSTLNSADGRIKANAAIVPAGSNGAVTIYASGATHVVIDINGYFVPASGTQNLAFFPMTPCRLADTRNLTSTFGGPSLAASATRTFPVLSGSCGLPATARAYAINMTVVPSGPLGFLAAWPAGSAWPGSSTLNAPTGALTSNLAIVPAGSGGSINVMATSTSDLIMDVTGYFAPPAAGLLDFYVATPCRILDTRDVTGTFGGPILAAAQSRNFPVGNAGCGVPATAKAYSMNATVVPPAILGFLTLWGTGPMPLASTLNSSDGTVVANAGFVPAGISGAVTAYTSDRSHLILDINGYFQ